MPRSKETIPRAPKDDSDNEPLIISPEEFAAMVRSGEIVIPPRESTPSHKPKPKEREGLVSPSEALRIMSPELCRGPEQAEQVFGFSPEVPPIPFTTAELEKAKERGETLRLRVSTTPAGIPLSVYNMRGILAPKFKARDKNAATIYESAGWKKDEPCWTTEAPRPGWVLTSDKPLPGTLNKNYLEQTDLLIAELKDKIYQVEPLPQAYQEAIQEYEREKPTLLTLAGGTDWAKAAKRLSELAITQLLRPSVSELCQDIFSEYVLTGKRLYPSLHSQTSSLSRSGYLVGVGHFDARGVDGDYWRPLPRDDDVGASFSRSVPAP